MKNKLRAFFFAAAAFVVISPSTPTFATVVPVPSDSINIDNGQFVIDEYVGGEYVVHNNSSNWYIYGFAVSNPNASTDSPHASFNSWVGVYANLSLTGLNTEPVNVYYSNYIDLSNGLDHDPGLLKGYLLSDGSVFDQTKTTPATFPLKRLIKGWQVALPMCREGGTVRIIIPSGMAYGIRARSKAIPPNSILVFDVEVVSTRRGG